VTQQATIVTLMQSVAGVRCRLYMLLQDRDIVTHTHTTVLWLSGFCLGQPGWASTRRNIHPLTLIVVINHALSASSIYCNPWHLLCSISTNSLQVFFRLPLGLAPSTFYSIPFFTQSLSSFRSTYPHHRNLFCCSTEIMSSKSSL